MNVRRIGALSSVMAMLVWMAPDVAAEPPPTPAPAPAVPGGGGVAESPTLTLGDLGGSNTLSFYVNRDITNTTLTFPVPPGLTPVSLKAGIELPINLRFGDLTVRQGDRTLSRLPLPALDQPQVVDIPLAGAQVSDNWVSLNLTMTAVPLEGYCWDPVAPIRLVNGAIAFAGTELPPTTVAGFLPPVLRKVTIAVPGAPSPAESNAAVQLAAAVAERNGQKPEVVVVPLPEGATTLPAPSAPLERQIIVKEGPDKGLSLQGGPGVPALLVSGPGNQLGTQARLLANDALKYAVSPGTTAEPLPDQPLVKDSTTIDQLTGSALNSEAMWPTVGIPIDQSRWGHPLSGVLVHLNGSYTPLPGNFGGEVIISIGNETIDRWPTEASGTINHTVAIPDRLLQRSTTLDVAVRTTGDPGHCGYHLPILLRIDGNTIINVARSNPPMPPAFRSLPQALMPRIRIGIGPDAFGDTVRAAQILVGLQRTSGVPLVTEVTTLQQAVASNDPAILISADGWTDKSIALPFTADQGRLTVTGLDAEKNSVTLDLDPATGFGSLQTVFDGQRTVLIATSTGVPGQLDELLRYLAAQPGRWGGLNGRAIISAPGVEPITVSNPPADSAANPDQISTSTQGGNWFWWAVGGVAVVAAAGAVAILMRARRE